MFVIEANKRKNRQFNLVNSDINQKFDDSNLKFFDCRNSANNTTIANSTTRTPNNFFNLYTLGATQINGISAHSIEEFLYTGNPYNAYDIFDVGSTLGVGSFSFSTGVAGTYTNFTATLRFADNTGLPAGLTIGEDISIWMYYKGGSSNITAITGTLSCTIKLMDTSGTLTTIGTTTTENLALPNGATSYKAIQNPMTLSGAGVTTSLGDIIIIEPTVTITSITTTGPALGFYFCFTSPGSSDGIRNRQSTISAS